MKKMFVIYSIIMLYLPIQPLTIKQGIAGKLLLKQGNQMPSPDQKPGMGKPVKRAVYIYELTKREQTTGNGIYFSHIKTKLVAQTQSDSTGNYQIELPAGYYSVFVDDRGQLFANSFDGKGNINPVEVKKNTVTTLNITVNSQAVY